MSLLLFAVAGLVLGAALADALRRWTSAHPYPDEPAALLDAVAATAVLTTAVWVATTWALALVGALRPAAIVTATACEVILGVAWLVRAPRGAAKPYPLPRASVLAAVGLVLAPVVLWTAFVAWRGTIVPVYNHDALAYHLPKAVLLAQTGRFRAFDVPEPRIASWPWNYELLLADTMLLTGSDALTAAVSTWAYVVLVLLAARIAAAWWGGGVHVALAAAFVASAPIVILHSGLHKNDLLLAVFAVAAMAWSGRWCAVGCSASAVLSSIALILALGTKVNAAFVVAATAPVLLVGAWRHRAGLRRWAVLVFVAAAAVASLLLGSAGYVFNLAAFHRVVLMSNSILPRPYGDWFAIPQFTAMLILAPFSPVTGSVWNPFRGQYWWWAANDVWMSHFGGVFSILAVSVLPCIVWVRRRVRSPVEAGAGSLAALAAYVALLPIPARPIGFFATEVRYEILVLPFVAAWTLSPIVIELERLVGRVSGVLRIVTGLAAVTYSASAFWTYGLYDAYAPLDWVAHLVDEPGDRVPFVRRNRAASCFDLIAGPNEACAIDVGFDTWIYPAYGRAWTRRVEFLRPADGPVIIPADVDWVIVDRSWNVFFGHPKFVDMGKSQYLGRGRPSADDLKVYRQLVSDPKFERVYDDRSQNQALFHRLP